MWNFTVSELFVLNLSGIDYLFASRETAKECNSNRHIYRCTMFFLDLLIVNYFTNLLKETSANRLACKMTLNEIAQVCKLKH